MPYAYGLNRTLGAAIGAIAVVALLSSGTVYVTLNQLRDAGDMRTISREIMFELDDFEARMLDQETSVRGYLLTGDEASLEPYRRARPTFDKAVNRLRELFGQNNGQRALLDQAEVAARNWQTNIGEKIATLNATDHAAAMGVESSGKGRAYFDAFRAKLAAMEAHEQRMLNEQSDLVATAFRNTIAAIVLGSVITLLMCGGVALAINRMIVQPLVQLAHVMGRLVRRDTSALVPEIKQRNEVGAMAAAVGVFKSNLIELDRTALLRATADTLPAMVGYIDTKRRIGFLNCEFSRWFDLKCEDVAEAHGRPVAQVFQMKPLPGASGPLDAALAGTESRFEESLTLRTGERRDVETYFRPHRGIDGKILGVVALLTDITDRKEIDRRLIQQTQELSRSNEELEQFAYVASHDLKAPLRGIENLVSWIEEDLEGSLSGDTRTNMDLLKSRVYRLESLLDDLLAYSRAGRDDLIRDTVDTKELVEELAQLVSPPEGFRILADPALPTLEAARAPLTQAIQNLIGNAIKHHDNPAAGLVTVEAHRKDGMHEFIVTDNGPGIPERYRNRVFGMFQTLRPRDEVEGSGMGLAIVKKLVERQNGNVWLSDGPDGKGLSVHFTWPSSRH